MISSQGAVGAETHYICLQPLCSLCIPGTTWLRSWDKLSPGPVLLLAASAAVTVHSVYPRHNLDQVMG